MSRNYLCVLLVIVVINIVGCQTQKKCLPHVNRIPVQRKFNATKFAGTWYTVSRTKYAWEENTYESASIDFSENDDGSLTYSLTGRRGDNKCIPVETGAMEPGRRNGQFILKGPDTTHGYPTMIVSYTNYNTALVYFCFLYRPGRKDQCRKNGWQAEIMTRSTQPRKRVVKEYLKRMQKRLCVPPKDVFATKPGECKIPEILAQAKDRGIAETKVADPNKKGCAVNNIPVKEDFHLSEMEGLWYEIARTRFTFNKMESVISYHRYDEDKNHIKSFYTGTTNSNCSTPIQGTSRTKEGRKLIGDMEGKIDSEIFDWAPLKILYVDDNYLMFYACYSGDSDAPCVKKLMEVTLVGRTRKIKSKEKKRIYKFLPKICVDPEDMVDTEFRENCTEWVENVIRETEINPSSCVLDDIQAYHDFDDISMFGEWYLYAHTNYSGQTLVMGNVLNITKGPLESFVMKHAVFEAEKCQRVHDVYARQNCLDTGDYVTSLPDEHTKGWVFSKIIYQDANTFVNYVCTQRNIDGFCNVGGVQAFVYMKNETLTTESQNNVNKALKSACINPDDLLKSKDWCDMSILNSEDIQVEDDLLCDIDDIATFDDIDDFDQTQIYGYWYEIAHSSGIYNEDIESFTAYFTSDTNTTLQIYYTGILNNGSVIPVERSTALPRCLRESNGDYLTEVPRDKDNFDTIAFAPMKVLFTDYEVLLTYICQEMLPSGKCSKRGSHIRLWSRNVSMDQDTREYVLDFAGWACIHVKDKDFSLVDTVHNETVFPHLENYVLENIDDIIYELPEMEITDEVTGQQADETEPEYDDFEYSLQRYLEMDDDEFYNAQK